MEDDAERSPDAEKYTDALGADTTSIITQVIPQRSLAPEVLPFASSLGPQNLALAAFAVAILLVSGELTTSFKPPRITPQLTRVYSQSWCYSPNVALLRRGMHFF